MAGGHATHSGIGFQDKVAAIMATHALADEPLPFLGLPGGVTLTAVELETNAPVDDILIKTSAKGYCFINVKKGVGISDDPQSPLGSVIDQFVRQWIACIAPEGKHEWQRPLDPEKDRLVLVTGGTGVRSLVVATSSILMRIADRHSIQPREEIATTVPQCRAYDAMAKLIRFFWSRHTGNFPSEVEIASLLSIIRVVFLDPDSTDKVPALALLRRVVLANPEDAEKAWIYLIKECHRLAEHRSSADRGTFRDLLRSAGFSLRHIPELENDIHRLEILTEETLKDIAHLAHLNVPTRSGTQILEIDRRVTHMLVDCAQRTSLLIIGPPGCGKSGTMHGAATQLRAEGHPVVVMAVDHHPVGSLDALMQDFGLSKSLFDVLKGWTISSKPGVLFIDALDATRGGSSEKVFQQLIRRIRIEVPDWRVVASIRVFDLRFGVDYRERFAGSPLSEEFQERDFPKVKHLLVPRLSQEELDQVWSSSIGMDEVYRNATEALRELLRSPFNLFLLAQILTTGGLIKEFTDLSTQVGLLALYWSHRVIGSDRREVERERLLRHACEEMVNNQVLFLERQIVEQYGGEDLRRLMSDGVLSPEKVRGDHVIHIAFSHHMLFDYAVARLVLEGGNSPDLAARLTASDDRALLLAPAAMIALHMLWESDLERTSFWDKAFHIAESEGAGAFCRMLPARVAAELTQRPEDFASVMTCLRRTDCIHRKAVGFLVRHCLGALAAGIVPDHRMVGPTAAQWCRIVRQFAEAAIEDIGWMLKSVISNWVEKPENLTYEQKQDLGEAARRLLVLGCGAVYDEGAVIIGIKAISRTFETAPTESANTLRLLLASDHLRSYGHRELFWLSLEYGHLVINGPNGPELLGEVYRAAYCTPLPSRDEQTNILSSRILGLISNKRQDFESARHQLGERFAHFTETHPVLATETLIDAMECHIREERNHDTEVKKFLFSGIHARYQRDASYVWMTHKGSDGPALLQSFIEGFCKVAEARREHEIDEVILTVARRNLMACVWASLLKVGATHPEVIGRRLLPLLSAPPVLAGIDTRKPAGDLLTILHPLLSSDERRTVEEAILATDREETQRILLGCLKREYIISIDAMQRRTQFESDGPLPANREPFSFEAGWGGGDDDWWLKSQGVDLSTTANAALYQFISNVEAIKPPEGDNATCHVYLAERWGQVRDLLRNLHDSQDAPEALSMKGWEALAEAAQKAAEACDCAEALVFFPDIETMVYGALKDSHWPLPQADPEQEESFARGPCWSSPSPRITGAAALMALARAKGKPVTVYAHLLDKLATDPHPAVRHQVLSRVNMLFKADSELMWRLCEQGFTEEKNNGVLSFFLEAVRRIMRPRPEWITVRLLSIVQKVSDNDAESRGHPIEVVVSLLLHLWLRFDQADAGKQIRSWIDDPIIHSDQVYAILTSLRTAIIQGDPENPNELDEQIRHRAVEVFQIVAMASVPVFAELASRNHLDEADRKTAETALRILDQVATEIYYGSGAYNITHSDRKGDVGFALPSETRRRFLREMKPTLEALSDAAYPSITHHLLETLEVFIPDDPIGIFLLVVRALTMGGSTGGYQYESMGASLFVRIIRRYLADFRSVLTQREDCRQSLMRALDIFVEAGWPEARRLVYELPEMLR